MTRWPWPGDTPAERARRIANAMLAMVPEEQRQVAVRHAHELGETWLGVEVVMWGPEDIVTTREASTVAHVGESTIRKWHSEGHLVNVTTGRYRVVDVLECSARMRDRRTQRRAA